MRVGFLVDVCRRRRGTIQGLNLRLPVRVTRVGLGGPGLLSVRSFFTFPVLMVYSLGEAIFGHRLEANWALELTIFAFCFCFLRPLDLSLVDVLGE